jgi:hypothetical protein
LLRRPRDDAEIFTINDAGQVRHWMAQQAPVLLVLRNAEGEVRWMDLRKRLRRASAEGKQPVQQIAFEGERFDVMSVRRWRDQVLRQAAP